MEEESPFKKWIKVDDSEVPYYYCTGDDHELDLESGNETVYVIDLVEEKSDVGESGRHDGNVDLIHKSHELTRDSLENGQDVNTCTKNETSAENARTGEALSDKVASDLLESSVVDNGSQHVVANITTDNANDKVFQCFVCGKCFLKQSELRRHSRIHSGNKPYRCHVCDKQFTLNSNLKTHLRTHSGTKPYQCVYCQESFTYLHSLQRHARFHNNGNFFECKDCNRKFISGNLLKDHLLTHTSSGAGVYGHNRSVGSSHVTNTNDAHGVACNEGSHPVVRRQPISPESEVNNKYDDIRRDCLDEVIPIQPKTALLHAPNEIMAPITVSEKPVADTYSAGEGDAKDVKSEENENENLLRQVVKNDLHEKCRMNNGYFKCPRCDKVTLKKWEFYRHYRKHLGLRPFQCNYCSKSFTVRCNLNTHLRLHTGNKPYHCSQCGEKFMYLHSLQRHLRIHNGGKFLECEKCNRKFTSIDELKKHIQLHREQAEVKRKFKQPLTTTMEVATVKQNGTLNIQRDQASSKSTTGVHYSYANPAEELGHAKLHAGLGKEWPLTAVDKAPLLLHNVKKDTSTSLVSKDTPIEAIVLNQPNQSVQNTFKQSEVHCKNLVSDSFIFKMDLAQSAVLEPLSDESNHRLREQDATDALMSLHSPGTSVDHISMTSGKISSEEACPSKGSQKLTPTEKVVQSRSPLLVDKGTSHELGSSQTVDRVSSEPKVTPASACGESGPPQHQEHALFAGRFPTYTMKPPQYMHSFNPQQVSSGQIATHLDASKDSNDLGSSSHSQIEKGNYFGNLDPEKEYKVVVKVETDDTECADIDSNLESGILSNNATISIGQTGTDNETHVYILDEDHFRVESSIAPSTFELSDSKDIKLGLLSDSMHNKDSQDTKQDLQQLNENFLRSVKIENGCFVCQLCGKELWRKSEMQKHLRIHFGIRPFVCPYCSKSFTLNCNLKAHIRLHTGTLPYKCLECGQRFMYIHSLQRHARVHNNGKFFECVDCNRRFTGAREQLEHMMTHKLASTDTKAGIQHASNVQQDSSDVKSNFFMPQNNFVLKKEAEEVDHAQNSVGTKDEEHRPDLIRYNGITQGTIFNNNAQNSLQLDRTSVYHYSSNLNCEGNNFINKEHSHHGDQTVNNHDQKWNAEKSYFPNYYKWNSEVKMDPFTHAVNRPYVCEICSKRFTVKCNLKTHMRLHSGDKPYSCSVCGERFMYLHSLQRHVRIHNSGKFLECKDCNRRFISREELRQHESMHALGHTYMHHKAPFLVKAESSVTVKEEPISHFDFMDTPAPHGYQNEIPYDDAHLKDFKVSRSEVPASDCDKSDSLAAMYSEKENSSSVHENRADDDIGEEQFGKHAEHYALKFSHDNHSHSDMTRKVSENSVVNNKQHVLNPSLKTKAIDRTYFNNDDHAANYSGAPFLLNYSDQDHGKSLRKEFQCPYCERVLTRKWDYDRHVRKHSGQKPFTCEYCNKSFGLNSSLKAHLRIHTNEQPYSCEECGMRFTYLHSLQRHFRVHNNGQFLECVDCNRRFAAKMDYAVHMKCRHSKDVGDTLAYQEHIPEQAKGLDASENIYVCHVTT